MQDNDRLSDSQAQEPGRIIAFPTPPGADRRVRRLRLQADAYQLAVESIELQIRAIEGGSEVPGVMERAAELVAAAGRLWP